MSGKQARAPSAYFIFCDEHRAQLQLQLNEQKPDGTKVAVSAVAKELGQRWKQLSDEERARYKEQAAARAAELAAAAAAAEHAAGDAQDAQDAETERVAAAGSSKGSAAGFPVAVLKRIMHADPEVTRASSDAVWAVGKAVELFMVALADKCHSAARSRKQSVVKMQDFVTTVRTDKRLCQAGLKDIAAGVQRAAEAAAAAAAAAPPKQAPVKRAAGGAGAAAGSQDEGQAAGAAGTGETAAAGSDGAAAEAAAEDEGNGRDQAAKRAKTEEAGSSKGRKKADAAAKSTHKITTFFVKRPEVAAAE